MSDDTAINIRPGVGILSLFPHMNYKPWYALGELVDNAVASYLANKAQLKKADGSAYQFRVVVELDDKEDSEIRVWDNAAGISSSDFRRAFVTAEPPPDATGLSQFGIGMKSASCWFARRWRVTTCALGESLKRSIYFDVPQIVENKIEDVSASSSPAAESDHFTEIRLWDLYKPPQTRTVTKIRDHLASMYRLFITSGDLVLEFNGEALRYVEPKVLIAPQWDKPRGHKVTWRKEVSFTLPTGEQVSGFAAIRETGSVSNAGFALFRKNRLIVGSNDDTYRPKEIFGNSNKFAYQRVFGELHLEGFDVSHTKDGFLWGDREATFLLKLRQELNAKPLPLLRQAENYRSQKASSAAKTAAKGAVVSAAQAAENAGPVLDDQLDTEPTDVLPRRRLRSVTELAERSLQIQLQNQTWEVTIELVEDPAITDWLSVKDEPAKTRARNRPRRLALRMSLSHPFMLAFAGARGESIEALLRVAVALGLAEITARSAGAKQVGLVRLNVNELLAGPLAEQG